mgnify:CR=1 FL=1
MTSSTEHPVLIGVESNIATLTLNRPAKLNALNYATIDGTLVFASEIKGILAFPGARRTPDFDAIHEYLTFQYVPSPMTAFAGIAKLPPAHLAVVERGLGTLQVPGEQIGDDHAIARVLRVAAQPGEHGARLA